MSLPQHKRTRWLALAPLPILFLAVAGLQAKIDAQPRTNADANEQLLLSSPAAVKKLSFGYDALLADIYWTRAVQYYGAHLAGHNADFHLLWPLLDVATTLDPKLLPAYHFGAIFLSEPGGVGAARTDLAIQLVKKGIDANPNVWGLGTDLGFLYYWRLKDYPNAAAAYLQTSKIPNAPPWIAMMAARISQTGGSLDTSRMIWSQIYESTQDPAVKKRAEEQLKGLKAQSDMQQLDAIAAEYQKRFGRYPASQNELRAAGFLPGIAVDPDGFAYELGPAGKFQLSPKSTFVMPAEPKLFSAPSP